MASKRVNEKIAGQNKQLREIEYYRLGSAQGSSGVLEKYDGAVDGGVLKAIANEESGFHVLFMPPIGDDYGIYNLDKKPKPVADQNGQGWQQPGWHPEKWPQPDAATQEILIKDYRIPDWFFKNMGWNANGFFGSRIRPTDQEIKEMKYHAFTRFLSKEVEEGDDGIGYGWTFMSFYLITRMDALPGRNNNLVILLCFDLPERLCTKVRTILDDSDHAHFLPSGTFAILPLLLFNIIMVEFERGLWSFQAPVRGIEKRRKFLLEPPQKEKAQGDKAYGEEVKEMEKKYQDIYELLRHALHITETIDVASKSLKAAHDEIQDLQATWTKLCGGEEPTAWIMSQSLRMLRFSSNVASNLDQRADAFVDRLRNEAKIISSLSHTRLLNQTIEHNKEETESDRELLSKIQELLQQTKDDSREFAQRISVLTLLLLPGTLIAGFFGMNFFDLQNGDVNTSTDIWWFFVLTVPITLFFLWWLVQNQSYPVRPKDMNKFEWFVRFLVNKMPKTPEEPVSGNVGGTLKRTSTVNANGNTTPITHSLPKNVHSDPIGARAGTAINGRPAETA